MVSRIYILFVATLFVLNFAGTLFWDFGRNYFARLYSRDLNRQRLNKGIKCRDLRVLNFIIYFKMTLKAILQFYSDFWGYVEYASIVLVLFRFKVHDVF